MKRISLFAAIALLAATALLAACGGKSDEATPPDEASAPAASEPDAAGEPEAPATEPVEITDALVASYMEYQKENIRIVKEYAEKARQNAESARGDTVKALRQIDIATQYGKEMEQKLEAKRRELGLSEQQFETARDAVLMTANFRMLFNQMGGDKQLAEIAAAQKAAIEGMPEAQRPAAQAEADKMMKSFTDARDLADIRQKYGDKSAEVLLRHADALAAQHLEFLQLGKK